MLDRLSKDSGTRKNDTTTSRALYVGLVGVVALIPVFLLPLSGLALEVGKIFFIEVSTAILAILWVASQVQAGKISILKSRIGLGFLGFSIIVLLSSAFSKSMGYSFVGEVFSTSQGSFLFSLGILGFLSSQVILTHQRVVALYSALIVPFIGISVFQIARFIGGPQFISLNALSNNTITLLGSWNDLGIYAGFIAVVCLAGAEFLRLRSLYRRIIATVLVLATFLILLTNVPIAWVGLAIASFGIFLYKTAFGGISGQSGARWRLPILSLSVFLMSLFGFAFMGGLAQEGLAKIRDISYSEVRLSAQATASTVGEAWGGNFLTGSGPNFFGYLWQETRNEIVSRTPLSDGAFSYGYSTLLTWLGTLGLVGGLVLLLILTRYIRYGARTMFSDYGGRIQRFFTLSAFVSAFYLWLILLTYVPGSTILALAFVFMGIFGGLIQTEADNRYFEISIAKKARFGAVVAVLFLVVLSSGLVIFTNTKKLAGLLVFRSAVFAQDLQAGYEDGLRASEIHAVSPYFRALSSLVMQQANQLGGSIDLAEDEEARAQLELFLGQSLSFANSAVQSNPHDYLNWLMLGDVQSTLRRFGVAGSYLNARQAYEGALRLNPRAHDVLARMASLELEEGNTISAQSITNSMLLRRAGDPQALVIASRIAYSDDRNDAGDAFLASAIDSVAGNLPSMLQIGTLAYNNERYELARNIFSLALRMNPSSVDSALGLVYSLDANGETEQAEEIVSQLVQAGILTEETATSQRPSEIESTPDANVGEMLAEPAGGEGELSADASIGEPLLIGNQDPDTDEAENN